MKGVKNKLSAEINVNKSYKSPMLSCVLVRNDNDVLLLFTNFSDFNTEKRIIESKNE